jgi:hypothetical protein
LGSLRLINYPRAAARSGKRQDVMPGKALNAELSRQRPPFCGLLGCPHRRVVPRTGRILEMFSPAGFEAFFRDLAEADRNGQFGIEDLRRIGAKFGVTFLV